MSIDHLGKFLVGFESLPFQARPPVLEEAPRPALALVVPKLADGPRPAARLLEQVGRVQSLVRRQQRFQAAPPRHGEILPMRQQRVFLALDEASALAAESPVFGLAYLVERFAQVTHDVKLVPRGLPSVVEQDRCLWRVRARGVAKRLPP